MIPIISKYQREIDEFKKRRVEEIKDEVLRHGIILPNTHILCKSTASDDFSLAHVPIPMELLENVTTKAFLKDVVVPGVLDAITKSERIPICLSFATETWMYTSDEPYDGKKIEDYEKFKREKCTKSEGVMVSFEDELRSTGLTLKKLGTKYNDIGEAIEGAYLEDGPVPTETRVEGLLAGMFTRRRTEN